MKQRHLNKAMKLYQTRVTHAPLLEGITTKEGLWIPYTKEMCACCFDVKFPSLEEPDIYLKHCRTLEHCKQLIIKRKGG